jgi:predicted transcriptional regulator
MSAFLRQPRLSRREREIMDVLYLKGEATAAQVLEGMPDPPSYSAVRALLRILEDKGHVRHVQDGPRYVYKATTPRDSAAQSALNHLVQTFYEGSPGQAISALLDEGSAKLSDEDLDHLTTLIKQARRGGKERR